MSIHRGRKGHVGYNAQLELLEYLVELIGDEAEVCCSAMPALNQPPVQLVDSSTTGTLSYVIRVKTKSAGLWATVGQAQCDSVQPGETRNIGWVELTAKHAAGPYWLTIHWATGEEEPWFLLSDCTMTDFAPSLNAIRMWTEELYGDLKSHGF
ncbi:MAG: hypothetical protein R2932_55325 [Caldilineaceae bacterium]